MPGYLAASGTRAVSVAVLMSALIAPLPAHAQANDDCTTTTAIPALPFVDMINALR